MWSARLQLRTRLAPCPTAGEFPQPGSVLWLRLSGTEGWLDPLRMALEAEGRLWTPRFQIRPVGAATDRGNPWAHRPDDYAPLRWGHLEDDTRTLREAPGRPDDLVGLVIDGILEGLGSQPARTLLRQAAGLLPEDAPWLLCERNGASVFEVVRNLRRDEGQRGEGRGTVRTAQELRRLLESAGLGVGQAWGLAPSGGARLRGRVPGGAGWPRLFLEGRRVVPVGE